MFDKIFLEAASQKRVGLKFVKSNKSNVKHNAGAISYLDIALITIQSG